MNERELLRIVEGSMLTGVCIDCAARITGKLAMHFIDTPAGVGIEIMIASETTGAHALGRVPLEIIPTVVFDGGKARH